jgi:uncharacterized protein YyaL (SSP411 family)
MNDAANRAGASLADATSLYLRLHANQPVAWWPWGEAAFEEARRRDLPVLLSVGYATCHWCHVMARESFDDPAIAALLNEHFVPIKVDREARPDVDAVYMAALQALTGSGGWPMTVALDHRQRPWWAGTYFPPHDRPGIPAFERVLGALQRTWVERREEVERAASEVTAALNQRGGTATAATEALEPTELTPSARFEAYEGAVQRALAESFDHDHGGFGDAPKFPPHAALAYLEATPSEAHTRMRLETLRAIADGGISDQLGGALHRYAVDGAWAVPHFEVMLVDQAQMLPRYARAAREGGDARLAWAAEGMLAALERDLLRPDGLFATGLDAEAAGVEGAYHTWTPSELAAYLPPEQAAEAARIFAVHPVGNLEGRSVLAWQGGDEDLPAAASYRQTLLAARRERPAPHRDEPAISAYNALMVRGLLAAAEHLPPAAAAHARDLATGAFERLWERAFDGERLRRVVDAPTHDPDYSLGMLEDQVHGGLAALALYRSSHDQRHLQAGLRLAELLLRDHALAGGGFANVPLSERTLPIVPRDAFDGATPAMEVWGAALLAEAAEWLDREDLRATAEGALRYPLEIAARAPIASISALLVARRLRRPVPQVVVVGDAHEPECQALLRAARGHPAQPLVLHLSAADDPLVTTMVWAAGREAIAGRATAYPCRRGLCRLPVHTPDALVAEIDALVPAAR